MRQTRGRPTRAEAPSVPKRIRFSPAELEACARAARLNGQNLANFVREAALEAAADCVEGVPKASPGPQRTILTPSGVLET